MLILWPSLEEIKLTVYSMDGSSALGLDGFTEFFFICFGT